MAVAVSSEISIAINVFEQVASSCFDRSARFIINKEPRLAPQSFVAHRKSTKSGNFGLRQITAFAVREKGTEKFAKVLRLLYNIPEQLQEKGIAVPNGSQTAHTLLGLGLISNQNVQNVKVETEHFLLSCCSPLTVGQHCVDWFVVRNFRITGTNCGIIFMDRTSILQMVGISTGVSNSTLRTEEE